MEIEEGLHRIDCLIGTDKPLYQHVLCGEDTIVWLDAGIATTPHESLIPYAQKLGWDELSHQQIVLVTHADVDHYGGLPALRAWRPQMTTMAHRLDVSWITDFSRILNERYRLHAADGMDLSPDRIAQLEQRGSGPNLKPIACSLAGGETLHLGRAGDWRIVHAPGHTPGHLSLWNEARKWAIISDAALGAGILNTEGSLVAPPPYYDVHSYVHTVRTLAEWKPERIYTSHFPVMSGKEAEHFLQTSLHMVDEIGSALQKLFQGEQSFTLPELCAELGYRLDYWPAASWNGLADPISAHLKLLMENGEISRYLSGGQATWRRNK